MRFLGRGVRSSRGDSAFAVSPNNSARSDSTPPARDDLPTLQLPSLELPKIKRQSSFDVPLKAWRLLGDIGRTSSGLTTHSTGSTVSREPDNRSQTNPPYNRSQANPPDRTLVDDRCSTHSTHARLLVDTMPGANNGGLKPWPSLQRNASMQDLLAAGLERPRMPAAPSTADSRHYIPREQSDSALRSHYDSSRQPLNISQQTSASAVRDMGLRKGPSLSEAEPSRRPLKSAMKHGSPEEQKTRGRWGGNSKKEGGKARRLDFGHLLHRNHHSGEVSMHPQISSSTSLSSDPYREKQVQPLRQHLSPPVHHKPTSSHSDPAARQKIFEKDVYDSAKVNVRRPPKGIKNWFDGFDISSDEEEQSPIELPAADVPPPPPVRKDSNKIARPQRHQDDVGSLLEQPRREEKSYERHHRPQQPSMQPRQPDGAYYEQPVSSRNPPSKPRRNPSDDLVKDNMQAIEQARQRMHARQQAQNASNGRKGSAGSVDVYSPGGSTAHGGGESRRAKSKVGQNSVLNLSDTSEDEKAHQPVRESLVDDGVVGNASHMDIQRPWMAQRQHTPQSSRNYARDTFMTTQTSGSIPITLSNDPPMPLPPARRGTQDSSSEHTAAALRRLIGRSDSAKKHKGNSKHASSNPEYEESNGGETVSSFPSEQSHMMAVSDEEMVLLEMMRIKRAAMQKNSFTEGYQQALKREQEQLSVRRRSAHQTAMKILNSKKQKGQASHGRIDEEGLDDEQRHRLDVLKQEDVDNQLKIERFFAMDTPLENVFPEPPSRSRASSAQHSQAPTTEELLLPRTYTPQMSQQSPKPSQSDRSQSERTKVAASPLLPSPSTMGGTDYDELDEAAQLEADLGRFLASGGRHESVAFPLPPKAKPYDQHSRKSIGLSSLLSPSLSPTEEEEEDVVLPRFPSRSSNRSAQKQKQQTPSPHPQNATDSGVENESSVLFSPSTPGANNTEFPDTAHMATPDAKRGTYTSIISSYQAHHRIETVPDLPYLITTNNTSTAKSAGTNSRAPSPSLDTSHASPLTPTFTPAVPQPYNQHHRVDIAGSDNPSPRTYASSDQSSFRAPQGFKGEEQHPGIPPKSKARKPKAALPPPLETVNHDNVYDRTTGRVGSVSSFTSASDDVLAAWAELGGGSEGFSARSRGRLRAR